MITLWRIFKTGFRNIFRNAWLSTAATAIMVVTLVIVTAFAFSAIYVNNKLSEVKAKVDLTYFIIDESKQEDVKDLQGKMLTLSEVSSVEYISKQDALKRLENSSSSGNKLAKAALEIGNPLPASYEVKVKDISQINQANEVIKKIDIYPKVVSESSLDKRDDNRKGVVENIVRISSGVARVGGVLSIVFLVISLLIIFNTIRMAIYTRREEIEIMKLVGATKWFIRGPFVVEGSLYGVLGATLALLILIPLTRAISPFIIDKLDAGAVLQNFSSHLGLVIAMIYGLGIIIGAISSTFAISRHLKL